jgi:hypothetical protein
MFVGFLGSERGRLLLLLILQELAQIQWRIYRMASVCPLRRMLILLRRMLLVIVLYMLLRRLRVRRMLLWMLLLMLLLLLRYMLLMLRYMLLRLRRMLLMMRYMLNIQRTWTFFGKLSETLKPEWKHYLQLKKATNHGYL